MRIFKYLFVAAEAYSPFDLHYANGIRAYHDQNWALTIQGNYMKNPTISKFDFFHFSEIFELS